MNAEQAVEVTFLAIAAGGLLVQVWGFSGVRKRRPMPSPQASLTRTVACRVFASGVYVLVGVNAVTFKAAVVAVSLGAFGVTQLLWTVNTVMDRRSVADARHRRRRFIQVTINRGVR